MFDFSSGRDSSIAFRLWWRNFFRRLDAPLIDFEGILEILAILQQQETRDFRRVILSNFCCNQMLCTCKMQLFHLQHVVILLKIIWKRPGVVPKLHLIRVAYSKLFIERRPVLPVRRRDFATNVLQKSGIAQDQCRCGNLEAAYGLANQDILATVKTDGIHQAEGCIHGH